MSGRIKYDPPMPSARDELTQRFPAGRVIKCLAFYKDPFWKKKGFSGEFICEDDVVTMGFDVTLEDGSFPGLVGFICGDYARRLSMVSDQERKEKVLAFFAKVLGPEALEPIHYMDKDWLSEPWYVARFISS
jgi:monoamine oxidase